MAQPLTLPPLSHAQGTALRQLYETAGNPKLRLRAQMVLLAHQGRAVAEIAALVFRSRATIERVLNRFSRVGRRPPYKAPDMVLTVTPEGKAALLRVIDRDPHTVGVSRANWTTGGLAACLATKTGMTVTAEPVRVSLRAAGYGCQRPTWPLKCTAEAQPGSVGNASGWR